MLSSTSPGPSDIGLEEVTAASAIVAEAADENANIIWGAQIDDSLEDEIRVTVIATGAPSENDNRRKTSGGALDDIFSSTDNDDDYSDIMGIFDHK